MANPFDQFDEVKRAAESQSSPARPAQPTSSAGRVAANPFDQVEATGTAPTASTNDAEMNRQFLDMLNKGARPAEIFKWARDIGRPLDLTDDQKNAVAEYVTFRDKQRDRGVEGDLFKDVGMVLETDERLAPLVPGSGPQAGDIGATLREGGNTVLFNFGDELVSGAKAPFQSMFNGESIGRNYRDNWLGYNVQDEVDDAARPISSGMGTAMGIAGSVALPGVATAGRGLMGRTLMGGAEGAVQGGVSATGAGDIDDRFENTGAGTIIGGGIGASLPGAIEVVGRVARPIVERLPGADSAKALARRLGLSVEEVEEARRVAAEQGELVGDDAVALIDALPEAGRAVVGTAGRQGAAREALQDVSRARELEAPARIQNQADRISPEMRTPDELRSGITRMRDEEISAAMAPIRETPIPLEQNVVDVLTTGTGLKAIRDAINNSEDVAVRNQLEELYAGLRDIRRSTDPRLPEATQQKLQGLRIEALPFTIDISDKISRALNRAGSYGFGGTVRDAARIAPRYNEIMKDYATRTRASEAVGVGSGERSVMDEAGRVRTERAQGAGFLDESPARYEQRVEGLSEEVPLTEGAYPEGTLYRGEGAPSERDLMRAGAAATVREEPLRAARQIVGDPNQQRRLTATVGEEEAATIRRAMDAELARVRRVQEQVTGSGPRSEGTAHAEGVVNTLYNPGPISMGREALRFLNRIGMTDRDATWIVQNATDPRQTDVILNRLEQLGLDRLRAESYVDMLRTMLVRGTTSPEE